jgi:hypothetical protein
MSVAESFPIVAVLDHTELAEIVLEHALDHATEYDVPDLHFLTVVEDPHASLEDIKDRLTALILDDLEAFQRADWAGHLHVRFGWVDREVPKFVREIGAKLVVLPANEDADVIVKALPCPALIVSLDDETGMCPNCAAVRIATQGEQLFCDVHAGDSVSLRTPEAFVGGTLMW